MAQGINISIASETRQFAQGVQRGVIEPLEDAAESLDDFAKEARQAGDGIEAGIGGGVEGAQKEVESATERMEKSFRELADTAKRESGKAEKSIKDSYKDAARSAKDSLDDVKSEASGTARETAASFDGSADSILGGLQEVAANAGAVYGPAGLMAGAAAAAGLGLLTTELQNQQAEASVLKERLADAYKSAAEEGRTYLDTAQVIATASDIMFNPDRAAEYKGLMEDAQRIGLDVNTLVTARAGDEEALATVIERTRDAEKERYDHVRESVDILSGRTELNDRELAQLGRMRDKAEQQLATQQKHEETARRYLELQGEQVAKEAERNRKATAGYEAAAARLDKVGEKIRDLPDKTVNVKMLADTSHVDAQVRRMQQRGFSFNVIANVVDRYGRRPV